MIAERLPGISETAKIFAGVDVTREPVPVLPTVHYNMGGVPTNHLGEARAPANGALEATVPGLMAIGEAACVSVHGANRLGSNSLLDLVVFGRAAANRCVDILEPGASQPPLAADAGDRALDRLDSRRHAKGGTPCAALRLEMQQIMQSHCAVFRTGEILGEGKDKLRKIWEGRSDMSVSDRSMIWNSDLAEALEFDNLLEQSVVSVDAALDREESRGAHAREDFPERDDENWMKHSLIWLDEDGRSRIDYRPVHTNTMTNEVQAVPPQDRVY